MLGGLATGEAAREGEGYPSFPAIREAAQSNPLVAERWRMMSYRPLEEFYDLDADPDQIHNHINDPARSERVERLRALLRAELQRNQPEMATAFEYRDNAEALHQYIAW